MGTLTCIHCYRETGFLEGHVLGCPRTRRGLTDDETVQLWVPRLDPVADAPLLEAIKTGLANLREASGE